MKKTKKRVLGLCGLSLVAGMTAVAVMLPTPMASAAGSTSMTDNISVRVVGAVPDTNVSGVENGVTIVEPITSFSITYENVETVTVTLAYTDVNGITTFYTLDDIAPDYQAGAGTYDIASILTAASEDEHNNYGEYVITVRGEGYAGAYDEDIVAFSYLPTYAVASEDEDTKNYTLDLDYAMDEGDDEEEEPSDSTGEVASIVINVYDPDGNIVEELSPIDVALPATTVELPFGDYGLPSGTYTIVISTYDKNGEELYKPYVIKVEHKAIPVPDTGAFFQNLNISRTDFLVTGLVVFSLVGIGGLVFISKHNRNKRALGRKRR